MLSWIVGVVAVWVVVGAVAAVWIGRAVSHADLEEQAAELRRSEAHDPHELVAPVEDVPGDVVST